MHQPSPILSAGCAFLLTISTTGIAVAGTPQRGAADDPITVDGAGIATIRSAGATVRVVATPGSGVSLSSSPSTNGGQRTLSMSMSTRRPKTSRDATAYRDSGRSVVGDLVALGMPRVDAKREFGDLRTMPADNAAQTSMSTAAVTPYDTQCASINVAEGKITGYGCATFFLVHQDGTDWWLTTKMKVSAHSNDQSWFSPKRLTQLGWRASWGSGNILYDWDPYSTRPVGSCLTMTVKSSSPWADVSVQGTVCPDSLGPWAVTTARSGGIWDGRERGTDYEGALATQAVHSPPGVPLTYQSAWTLSYCDLWC
jgi:hypothetical protein